MAIICSVCGRKQGMWEGIFSALSPENREQKICPECYSKTQSLIDADDKNEAEKAMTFFNENMEKMSPEAKNIINTLILTYLNKEEIKTETEEERIEREKNEKEQRQKKNIEEEEFLRKARERENEVHLNQLKEKGAEGYYEYKVISLLDEAGMFSSKSGKVNVMAMTETLNNLGMEGWHLVTAYSNELGKNALSGGVGGAVLGVNSTVDEHILIFERFVKL